MGVKLGRREEYAIDYVSELLKMYKKTDHDAIFIKNFGILKWDKSYKRLFRGGWINVILELTLIACGFNPYKYHNKKRRKGSIKVEK